MASVLVIVLSFLAGACAVHGVYCGVILLGRETGLALAESAAALGLAIAIACASCATPPRPHVPPGYTWCWVEDGREVCRGDGR